MNRRKKKHVIILAGKKEGHLFSGESDYYKDLLIEIENRGGKGVIFPLSNRYSSTTVYYWDAIEEKWKDTRHPIPHVVYNRFPYRKGEMSEGVQSYFRKLKSKGIPIFNDSFFNKEHIAKLIKGDDILKNFFPKTVLLNKEGTLKTFLTKYNQVFIKDVEGAQGKGIWKVERIRQRYTLHSQRKIVEDLSFSQLHYLLKQVYLNRRILIQEGIPVTTIDGTPYDFRVLMHFYKNNWQLTGLGARQARENGFTTHVPQGGRVVPMDQVPIKPKEELVHHLGKSLGELLQRYYTVREFSFDIGMDQMRNLSILDVNSKPMTFDEEHIQRNRIQTLVKILLNDT
ncbi:YheC/YheD family protein [Evansella tamaricis]|uniref:YheC/YheD family protein n=1 Tax=Evansella tamaricis TaxID=2069301 RepID=A0ABS6JC81_9BACI|nr:YheC/YheD family protein [Evansella tamaricis]MBU9711283.1 YheC/YheD family protein [Evansella tamaricis]